MALALISSARGASISIFRSPDFYDSELENIGPGSRRSGGGLEQAVLEPGALARRRVKDFAQLAVRRITDAASARIYAAGLARIQSGFGPR